MTYRWCLQYCTRYFGNMGTQDNDLLGYFGDERDRAETNAPSVDNLFSNRDGKPFV